MSYKRLLVLSTIVLASMTSSSFAGPASLFHPGLRRALTDAPAKGTFTIEKVALGRQTLDTFELERMEVWASDAKIIVFDGRGGERLIAPPLVKYFKGRLVGDDQSVVFFSMSEDGSIRGLAVAGERRWNIGSGVRRGGRVRGGLREDYAPVLISEMDVIDDFNDESADWECQLASVQGHEPRVVSEARGRAGRDLIANAGDVVGATYQLRLGIETDGEFCAAFSDNTTNITTYIGDLVGKATTVYSRDLSTTLVIGETHLRTGGGAADPWTVLAGGGTAAALAEFGTYWHNNYSLGYPDPDGGGSATAGGGTSVPRSSAIFLSGKIFNGGIAWFDFLCGDNFYCGDSGANCGSATYAGKYAGAYAFNGSVNPVTTTVPDPTATVNGVLYGLPTGATFWMLLELLHELGHNAGGPHTQCVQLTAQEKIDYGTSLDFVDECSNFDGGGCFSGSGHGATPCSGGYCPGGVPPEKGTLMSYCHNIFSGGFRQSRYLFGEADKPSEKVLSLFRIALEAATPVATITAQTQPVACSAGRTASVATCSGCTYAWQISGGTITSSTTTSSITYTPSQSSVTLTATIVAARGCGITSSKVVTTSCVAVLPPTNVVATATSNSVVNVSWTSSAGASSYNVYRSTDNITFTLAGNTASTSFNDGGRSANAAYMYLVKAVSGGESAESNKDFATTVMFTDPTIGAQSTIVKAAHVAELRTGVNAMRALNGGQSAFSFTDATLDSTILVKAVHFTELQAQLNAVRGALGFSTISFSETPSANALIEKTHLDELRPGIQ